MAFLSSMRHSLRSLVRAPRFSATVIVVLGLGIAGNTTIFTLVDELLLHPFPYQQPQRLAMVWEANPARGGIAAQRGPVAWANFHAWQAENHAFQAMEAYEIYLGYNLTSNKIPEHVTAARCTPGFFTMLGVAAAQGRTFLAGDDTPNSATIAVLTQNFSRKHFGDSSPLGQRLLLDGIPYTVVGVLPSSFHLPAFFGGISEYKPDIWLPLLVVSATDPPDLATRHRLVVWGRLKPNVSFVQAQEDMDGVAARRREEDPALNQGYGINVFSIQVENTLPDFRNALRFFSLAVLVVLFLACTNLAGLMLIRTAERRRELAIMAALGATRWPLLVPALAESLILAVISGILGFLVAFSGIHIISTLKPSDILGPERLAINLRAFLFTALVSVLIVFFFGFLPALLGTRGNLNDALKCSCPTRAGNSRTRSLLVSIQISAALTLTIVATLLARSFQQILQIDPGFRSAHVLTAHLSLPQHRYATAEDQVRFCRQLQNKLQSLPGTEAAALIDNLPFTAIRVIPFAIEGRPAPDPNRSPYVDFAHVSPTFFQAMGIALRQGRLFTDQDAEADPPNVVIINQTLAAQFWTNQDPIGSHIRQMPSSGPPGPWQTVIGVVQDFRQFNIETPARPELLWPAKSFPQMTVVLRTGSDPDALRQSLLQAVWSLDHDQPVSDIQTLQQILTNQNSQRRFNMLTISAFAGFSILLTLLALYGLLSSFISAHTRDIGIRLCLGCQRHQVCWSVLKPALPPVLLGIIFGFVFSFLAKRLIASVLFQTNPLDPAIYIVVPSGLIAILAFTSLAATLRATRIDPVRVLREE